MIKNWTVPILVAMITVPLMLLFPPYDYPSPQNGVPNFAGFLPRFGDHPGCVVNNGLLSFEIFTVLMNAAIVRVLLGEPTRLQRRRSRRKLVLLGVGLSLLLALLFPPFQDNYTASEALLPTFDGFYFVFGDNSARVLVAVVLWFEAIFISINGAVLWLLF